MTPQLTRPRRGWRALSAEEKQQRLEELRLRQQVQIELELQFLRRH